MSRQLFRSTVFALALGFFALQTVGAPLSRDRGRESEPQLAHISHVLVVAWERLKTIWEKNGSGIDPFGKPEPGEGDTASTQDGGDNGSIIDPFG